MIEAARMAHRRGLARRRLQGEDIGPPTTPAPAGHRPPKSTLGAT
jgi:hypothetical protein